ncbi:hypothetical protein O1W17_40175, partial [Streptomyces sp. H34-S5]|nr:hypothetical protein [Streptomyces sp. H34-S5]
PAGREARSAIRSNTARGVEPRAVRAPASGCGSDGRAPPARGSHPDADGDAWAADAPGSGAWVAAGGAAEVRAAVRAAGFAAPGAGAPRRAAAASRAAAGGAADRAGAGAAGALGAAGAAAAARDVAPGPDEVRPEAPPLPLP